MLIKSISSDRRFIWSLSDYLHSRQSGGAVYVIIYLSCSVSRSYAPWCPACQQLQPVWKEFADWGDDMGVNIAKVDVTEQPGRLERPSLAGLTLPKLLHKAFRRGFVHFILPNAILKIMQDS